MSDERELTFGERAVSLTFNPSGDPEVKKLKELYAQIIDICHERRGALPRATGPGGPVDGEAGRLWSIAITEAQGAQMWSVKAATWRS